jgi:hypothetical protein
MDERYRYKLLDVPYKIQVRGLSMLMNRESIVQRLMQLMQLTMQMGLPPPNQLTVLFTLISALGFTPEQLGYPPSPEAMMQIMMGMPPPGAQPGAMGGAPEPVGGPPSPQSDMNAAQTQGPPMAA